MPDTKLSALVGTGTTPAFIYGIEGGNSKKYVGLGIYNVRNYGAVGDGVANDTAAFRSACSAANAGSPGAIVWVPPGQYKLDTFDSSTGPPAAVHFNGQSGAGIRIIGCGLLSRILNYQQSYMFDIDYGTPVTGGINKPVASFEYLSFAVRFNQGSAFAPLVSTEVCAGGIHISGGIGVPNIHGCYFELWNGIGVYSAAQNISISNTSIDGNYPGTHADRSIGFMSNSMCVRDCKITACGYGIVSAGSGGGVLDTFNIDIEVCGTGIADGYSPVAFLNTITP